MEKDNGINKPKKTKWQRTRAFWIPFWSIFNPITLFIIFSVVIICIGMADTPNYKDSQKIAREKLAPLCIDNGYVYDNIEGSHLEMNYSEYHSDSDLAKIDTNGHGTFDGLLFILMTTISF